MDFENYTFLKVEKIISYESQQIFDNLRRYRHRLNDESINRSYQELENNKLKLSSNHELTLFCCVVKENEKWGCINQDKEEVISCIYEKIEFFGCIFLEATMLGFSFLMDNEGVPLCRYGSGEKYREIRFYGYQAISKFDRGLAIGIKDGYQGIVNCNGGVFLKPEYDYIDISDVRNKHIVVKKNKSMYDEVITKDEFKWRRGITNMSVFVKPDNVGFVTDDAKQIVGSISSKITDMNDIKIPMMGKFAGTNNWNLFDQILGEEQIISILYFENLKCWKYLPQDYSFLKCDEKEKHFLVKKDDKVGVLDFSYKMLIPPIYTELIFYEDIIIATNTQSKKGILKRSDYKTILLDFEFADFEFDKDFIIATNSQGEKGILKRSDCQSILLDFEYDVIRRDCQNFNQYFSNLIIIKNDLKGICTQKGKILIEPIFKKKLDIYPDTFDSNLVGFRKNGKDGFINLDGEIVLLFDNDKIKKGFDNDGKAVISNNYSQKTINKQGDILEKKVFNRYGDYPNYDELERDTWYAFTDEDYPEDDWDGDLDRFGVD
jgi:hypothetical protein